MNTVDLEPAVAAPVEAYIAGLNAHDLDGVINSFTDDVAVMPPEAETVVGLAAARAEYIHRFTMFDYGRVLHVDEWFADGDVAVVRCHTTGLLTVKATGVVLEVVARELFGLQRVDGQWKIRCYMFNRTSPA